MLNLRATELLSQKRQIEGKWLTTNINCGLHVTDLSPIIDAPWFMATKV